VKYGGLPNFTKLIT